MHLPIPSFPWLFLFQSIAALNTTDIFEDILNTQLPEDKFQINETKPETRSSTNKPYDTLNSTKMSMSEIQPIYAVECNHSVSGFLYSNTTVYIDFNVTNTTDVVITNCPSYHWVNVSDCDKSNRCSEGDLQRIWDWDLDTMMYLKDSNEIDITNQSWNLCGGDNCYVSEICILDRAGTMVMKALRPNHYRLELSAVDNSSDLFVVSVSCGDFSNLTSIWDPYHCDDSDASLFEPFDTIIGCDMSISGHLTCGETKTLVFLLFEEDNVVFETCGSDFDTRLYLYNVTENNIGTAIQRQSINDCDADDCHWTSVFNLYCDGDEYPKSEIIPMMNLPAGLYFLDLSSWRTNVYGEYNLEIHCGVEMPESFNGTLDHCNYMQLGTLQGELKKLPYPFNESIQDDAVYPIGYCHHIRGIPYSFEFVCTASGGIQLRTWENTKNCEFIRIYGAEDIVQNDYMNTSGMNIVSVLLDSD